MRSVFKLSGTLRKAIHSKSARRLALTAFVMLLALPLANCQHTGIQTSVTDNDGQCVAWRKILASRKDTAMTVQQVREHNATGRRLRCWK